MPNILYPPPRPQSVGEILDSAFRIFSATLLKCLPYSFLGVMVGHLTTFYDLATGHPVVPTTLRARQTHDPLWWILLIVATFAVTTLTNAVLLRQYALATGPLIRWVCAVPVYLLTERGPVASMSHSWQLTAGHFWRLSVIYAVGIALIIVLYVLSGVIGAVIALLLARGDVAVITATSAVVVTLLGAVVTPFYSALVLAVLGDVSVRREGADLAQRLSAPAQ
ncbi:MAG: hypothetical protein E6K50_02600 [Gammaproteobacteria bacterium]|nr:MAG: hypothetical protein E6K50_02600 [Gammaproteobacteria bacterium]